MKRQRYTIAGLATLMVAALLVVIPAIAFAQKTISYTFVFEHTDGSTTEISGVATDNDTFIAEAGGTSVENPTGMFVHVSCSDEFPGGWGEKEGPVQGVDTEWRVKRYTINKDGKICQGGDPIPPKQPAIDIEKATNGEDADDPTGPEIQVGDTVTWTYVVTNTGETELTDVEVIDYVPTVGSSDSTVVDCPETTLAVGEAMTCTMTGVAELGQYENTAKVTAMGETGTQIAIDGKKKQFTFIFEHTDGSTTRIDGSADKNEVFLPDAGGMSATNPTGMTVHVSCSDEFPGGWGEKDGPQQGIDTEWRIQRFWIREVKDGEIKKSCGSPIPNETMVMDQDPSHYIGVPGDPGIDIEKATNGEDADNAPGPGILEGNRVTWTYVVTNTGDVDLFDIEVNDDMEGFIGTIAFLEPGDSATLEHIGTAEAGQYENEGCAVGTSADQREVDDCDPSHYYGEDPYDAPERARIDIEKATNGIDADDPTGPRIPVGNDVVWTYEITNTGDVDLWSLYLYDEEEGRVTCPDRDLRPGETVTCTLRGTAEAGQYANEAWVDAWDDDGNRVSDSDWSHYYGVEDPYDDYDRGDEPKAERLTLEKRIDGDDADHRPGIGVSAGSQIDVTYVITNNGDETLYGVYLYDEDYGHVTCPMRWLKPGQSMTCSITVTAMSGTHGDEAWVDAWTDVQHSASDYGYYTGS